MPYDPDPFYSRVHQQIPLWAANRDDLRVVLQVGSRARRDHPGDRYSDADYLLFANDPAVYLNETDWTGSFVQVDGRIVGKQ
jgi:aminoglycoside 6-adenylyltransferase